MPATFPMGSNAIALLLGSTAKLRAVSNAIAVKNITMLGGSPNAHVISSNNPPTTVYMLSSHRMVLRAPKRDASRELVNVLIEHNNATPANNQTNNAGLL